ncbi:hypothetical protein [Streptomyces celluloflavus]|uniref:hypothetical protein n=1 Tax=Streptomyces celluloflavus TaxID=58344 RepID=UPI003669E423
MSDCTESVTQLLAQLEQARRIAVDLENENARLTLEGATLRAKTLREAADDISALPQDYECDPGRGDAADLLRSMADAAVEEAPTHARAAIVAERDNQIIAWLVKKAREYRATGSQQHAQQADAIEQLASKIRRGAVRPPTDGGGAA